MTYESKQRLFNYFHELTDGKVLLMEDDYGFIENTFKSSSPSGEQGEQGEVYKWVKASEEKPTSEGYYVCRVNNGFICSVFFHIPKGWFFQSSYSFQENVKEWLCKLSSPPEGQDERGNHPEIPDSSKQDELWEEIENELDGQVYRNQINRLKSKYLLIKK